MLKREFSARGLRYVHAVVHSPLKGAIRWRFLSNYRDTKEENSRRPQSNRERPTLIDLYTLVLLQVKRNWQAAYPSLVRRLEQNLPELGALFQFPRHLGRELRTTNVIESCFVEVRRRTRPLACFVNMQSLDRIIYAIFNGYNEQREWRNCTLRIFTQAA